MKRVLGLFNSRLSKQLSKKLNNKGFSLVELMVVVAIIGILAVIGIPQYQKFMSRARQAEAKTHLNAIFQGESAFFTEYAGYTTNLQAIGGGAVGVNLRYVAGFNAVCAPAATYTATVGGAGGPIDGVLGTNTRLNDAAVNTANAAWFYTAAGIANPAGLGTCTAAAPGASTYVAGAWGNPTNIAQGANNNADQFTINQNRLLTQVAIGL